MEGKASSAGERRGSKAVDRKAEAGIALASTARKRRQTAVDGTAELWQPTDRSGRVGSAAEHRIGTQRQRVQRTAARWQANGSKAPDCTALAGRGTGSDWQDRSGLQAQGVAGTGAHVQDLLAHRRARHWIGRQGKAKAWQQCNGPERTRADGSGSTAGAGNGPHANGKARTGPTGTQWSARRGNGLQSKGSAARHRRIGIACSGVQGTRSEWSAAAGTATQRWSAGRWNGAEGQHRSAMKLQCIGQERRALQRQQWPGTRGSGPRRTAPGRERQQWKVSARSRLENGSHRSGSLGTDRKVAEGKARDGRGMAATHSTVERRNASATRAPEGRAEQRQHGQQCTAAQSAAMARHGRHDRAQDGSAPDWPAGLDRNGPSRRAPQRKGMQWNG